VENNIHITGYLPFEALPWYLGCADLFILPLSNNIANIGRWPNKLGDYMCLGRPIVSNPVGEIRRLFEAHEIGLLADWDPIDFSRQIIYLLKNPDIADQLGNEARRVALTEYDWSVLINKLEEFYFTILDARQLKQQGIHQN
jgi:glycosyltransferase involved in cell wall biosynthesis